jgi:hypothetical protein
MSNAARRTFWTLWLVACAGIAGADAAQDAEPVELLCTGNRATVDGRPAGPDEIKVRINYRLSTVELLGDDGRTIAIDRKPGVTDRTVKWGVGIYGLNTWKELGLSYNVSDFEGSIDRESGTADVAWTEGRRDRVFRNGHCRLNPGIKF